MSENDATLDWTTSMPRTAKVYYGTTTALGQSTTATTSYVLSQSHLVAGLLTDQTYYYDVESVDHQGNAVRDDNGGLHYTFTTDRKRDVLLVIGDWTFDKKVRYPNAFARTGWTYSIWEGAQSATPYVGDLAAGHRLLQGGRLQTGSRAVPAVHRRRPRLDREARHPRQPPCDLLAGRRLGLLRPDLAGLHGGASGLVRARAEGDLADGPGAISQVKGIASDPISGAYTAGITYTAHRDGGAGDEVNGIAGSGSFAYDWRDNVAPADDIALRWTGGAPVGSPLTAVWGGTANKCSSNFFEWAHLNNTIADDVVRADVLDKTLIWLVGRDHPTVDLTAPNGGEVLTASLVSISWTEAAASGFSVASRKIYYSSDSGDTWTLITSAPGASPYSWNVTAIPNGIQYRIRIVVEDNGTPVLSGVDASAADFTINRVGGDTRGPVVVAGSITIDPNPIVRPNSVALAATVTDVPTGNSIVAAAEWSRGPAPAAAGTGTALSGAFTTPTEAVSGTVDSQLLSLGTDKIWVRGRDAAGVWGNATALDVVVNGDAAGIADGALPARFALHANAPNPFGPVTTIRFDLPRPSSVRLDVFDISGRRVRALVDEQLPAGTRSIIWDGRDDRGNPTASGIYFYRFNAGAYRETRKMTLLK